MAMPIHSALLFLINTVFDLYAFILIMRIIFAYAGFNYFEPIVRFTIQLTDFIVKPLRRLIPNYRRIEFSSLLLVIFLLGIKFLCVALINHGFPNIVGVFLLAIADSAKMVIQAFTYAIILQAIISFIQPMSPISRILYQFTAPIMRPLQRLIPPVGGIDLSPIPALIGLQLLIIIFVNPLMMMGAGVAFG